MSEPAPICSETATDVAMAKLRSYLANRREDDQLQDEAHEAIPGYSEALQSAYDRIAKSGGGGGVATELIPYAPQMKFADEKFAGRCEERKTERDAVAAAFALLDESDIRRLLAAPSQTAMERDQDFTFVVQMLVRSRNPDAVAPLMDRLQNGVEDPLLEGANRFWRFVHEIIDRDSLRTTRDLHRANDRCQTIRAIGCLGDRRAEQAIRPFLEDTSETVRKAARRALEEIEKANVAD